MRRGRPGHRRTACPTEPLAVQIAGLRRDLGCSVREGRAGQVAAAAARIVALKAVNSTSSGSSPAVVAFQKNQTIVRYFREDRAEAGRAVPDAALGTRAEARAMPQRWIPKGRRQQVVKAPEPRSFRQRWFRAIDQLLEQLLLGVAVDQLSRRNPVLSLDRAPACDREAFDRVLALTLVPDRRRRALLD